MCPPDPAPQNGDLPPPGKAARSRSESDIARLRRRQIVEAARQIIAEQGIQNLSLDRIEKRTRMRRGQLTYYFPHREEILLAVFDDMVANMRQEVEDARRRGDPCHAAGGWELILHVLGHLVEGPPSPEFGTLQFTFLAQSAHRDDFRQRLASLYAHWRTHMAAELTAVWPGVPAKAAASLVQAIFHGVVMQLTADPEAFDRAEFLEMCKSLVSALKQSRPTTSRTPRKAAAFRRPSPRPRGEQS